MTYSVRVTTLEKRRLGKSKLYVFPIGLGCRKLGYKSKNIGEAITIVQKAIKLGINFIDTANIYQNGKSEEIIGQAIQDVRKQVILATKGSIVKTEEGLPTQDLSPKSLKKAVEESLKRLNTNYIDLYQIHYPDPMTPFKDTVKVLKEFLETGTIKYVGLSNFSYEELKEWTELMEVPTIQIPYNFLQQKLYRKLLPFCQSKQISMITYTPLLMGLLTEKIMKDTKFSKNDERSIIPTPILKECKKIIKQLKPIAEKHNKTVTQLILNWLMNRPNIGCVLVGVNNIKQVVENVKAAKWNMPVKTQKSIEDLVKNVKVSLDEQFFIQTVKKISYNYSGKNVAILEMGMKIKVPSEVKAGDKIKISWNGEFLEIVK